MKIYPINHNQYSFKSQKYEDDGVLGYSDSISEQRRDDIRKWQETYYTPYQSIYEKECNLTEYQMKQLLGTLMQKTKVVDYDKVTGINAYHVRPIDDEETCFRGSTLARNPRALKTLKDAGIERVIDLVGYYSYENSVKEAGLEYYCPDFGRGQMGVWDEEAFDTKENLLSRETKYFTPLDFEKNKKYLELRVNSHEKHIRQSVNRFVDYIETMQKGYYYIGCEYGTYKTDNYLLLNSVFNPKAEEPILPHTDLVKIDMMKDLYKNLTPEDKKRMGWTKEFDENVPKRLDTAANAIIRYNEESQNWNKF